MRKIICAFLILSLLSIFSGCKAKDETLEKAEKYISGYVMEKETNNILVGSAVGNYKFNIENAQIESEDEITLDDMCDIYYYDELRETEINNCIKVVEFYSNYIIGEISDIDIENKIVSAASDSMIYKFSLEKIDDEIINNIRINQMYEIKFDKKLTTSDVNIATEINILEVDETPKEELELVDSSIS